MGNRWKKVTAIMLAVLVTVQSIDWTGISSLIPVYGQEVPDGQNTTNISDEEYVEENESPSEEADTPVPAGENWETQEGKVEGNTTLKSDTFLTEDITVNGDLTVNSTLQLNGNELTVNGTLYLNYNANIILDGKLTISGNVYINCGQILFYNGTLDCEGDFILKYMRADQKISMLYETDSMLIEGDFIIYNSISGSLEFHRGEIKLNGDLIELQKYNNRQYQLSIQDTFQFVLSGENSQMIDIQEEDFSTARILLQGEETKRLYVTKSDWIGNIEVEGGSIFPSVFRINQKIYDLYNNENINSIPCETVYLESGELIIRNYFDVKGNFIQNGSVTINNSFYVEGNYYIQKLDINNGEFVYTESEGSITLNRGRIYVYKDFVMQSIVNHESSNWNGYLYIDGNFYQYGVGVSNFNPSDTFQCYFTGNHSSIYFDDYENNWMPTVYSTQQGVRLESVVQFTNAVYGNFQGKAYVREENYSKLGSSASITVEIRDDICLSEDWNLYSADIILYSNLDLNGHNLRCKSMTLEDNSCATLTMRQGEELRIIEDFYVGSQVESGELSNGMILVSGNITQKNTGVPDNLVTTDDLTIQMCGSGRKQTVSFDSPESVLKTVEINNTSGGYVELLTPVSIRNLINTSNSLLQESRGIEGYTLQADTTYNQDVSVLGGDLDLNGHTLTIHGNLTVESGSLVINEGTLVVDGILRFQTPDIEENSQYKESYAILVMKSDKDQIVIGEDLYLGTKRTGSSISAGTIELNGNLYVLQNTVSLGKEAELKLTGNNEQVIQISTGVFNVGKLTIQNQVGIQYKGSLNVQGVVSDSGCTKIGNLYVDDLNRIDTTYKGDLIVQHGTLLNQNLEVNGKVVCQAYLNLQNHSLQADEIECKGGTTIGSGILSCNHLTLQGALVMKDANGVLEVGNLLLQQKSTPTLTDGTILIHGDMKEAVSNYPFVTKDNCVVILEGLDIDTENKATIQFSNYNSRLEKLVLRTNWAYYDSNRELSEIANQILSEYYDAVSPTVPQNVEEDVISCWWVTFSWEKATDNEDQLGGYIIYRDGEEIARTSQNYYRDDNCNHNTRYQYQVAAYDYHGNVSALSEAYCITTDKDTTPPKPPSKLECTAYSETTITIQWPTAKSGDNVKEYRVYRNDEWFYTQSENGNAVYSVLDESVEADETYIYAVETVDYADNVSKQIKIQVQAIEQPTAVTNLQLTTSGGNVKIQWSDNQEGITAYRIYRGTTSGTLTLLNTIRAVEGTEYAYLDENTEDYTRYYYKITPVLTDVQCGEDSDVKSVRTGRDTCGPVVRYFRFYNEYNDSILNQDSYNYIVICDNRGVKKVDISYQLEGDTEWIPFSYKEIKNSLQNKEKYVSLEGWINTAFLKGRYTFKIVATDINGNTTTYTKKYDINCSGMEAPIIVNKVVKDTSVSLEWTMPEGTDASFEIQILKNGAFDKVQSVQQKTYCTISDLLADQEYTIRIVPYSISSPKVYGIPSDPITILTVEDSTNPSINSIKPSPTYIGDVLSLQISVSDNNAVESLELEYSFDKEEWIPLEKLQSNVTNRDYTFYYNYDTKKLSEGSIYIRAFAYDYAGNKSQGIQNEYIIDHTPPKAVDGLTTYDIDAKVGLCWNPIEDCSYVVMRKNETGTYEKLGRTTSTYYTDNTAVYGQNYQYFVYSVDIAGNYGAASNEVTGRIMEDIKAPVISQIDAGYASSTDLAYIRVEASDNIQLESVLLEYENQGIWNCLEEKECTANHYYTCFTWSVEDWEEGVYPVRCLVRDINGYETVRKGEINVDRTPPNIQEMSVVDQEEYLYIQWDIYEGDDFSNYYLYRINDTGTKQLIYRSNVVERNTVTDSPIPGVQYTYQLIIEDKAGNKQVVERVGRLSKTDEEAPKAQINFQGETVDKVTVEVGETMVLSGLSTTDNIGVASMKWYMDEMQVSKAWSMQCIFDTEGEHQIKLKASDYSENVGEATVDVSVVPARTESTVENGSIRFQIVDENYVELQGAELYYQNGNGEYNSIYTDSEGKAVLQLPEGEYSITAYMDGYLPVQETVYFESNKNATKVVVLKKQSVVVGNMTVTEMTMEEILEQGIDINASENRDNVKVEISNTYKRVDHTGTIVTEEEQVTLYNNKPVTQRYSGGSSGSGSGSHVKTTQNISPNNQPIIVIVDTQSVSWLKEMFRVDIQICNMADEPFDLSECTVNLNLPNGISLIDGLADNEFEKVIGSIPAGESYESTWYIKGDEIGTYGLTADFYGILEPIGRVITARFQTEENIEISRGEGLVLYVYPESTAHIGQQLYIQYQLVNEGDHIFRDIRTTFGTYQEAEREPIYINGNKQALEVVDYYVKNVTEAAALPVLYQGDTVQVTELKPGEAIYGTYVKTFGELVTEDGEIYGDINRLYKLLESEAVMLQGNNSGLEVRIMPIQEHHTVIRFLGTGKYISPEKEEDVTYTLNHPPIFEDVDVEEEEGDPVNVATGAYQNDTTALSLTGIEELTFRLYYNSLYTLYPGELGYGWSHNYEMKLEDLGGVIYLHKNASQSLPFIRVTTPTASLQGSIEGSKVTLDGVQGEQIFICTEQSMKDVQLIRYDDGTYILEVPGESTYQFDGEGRLERILSHTGNEITLTRGEGTLKVMETATGCYLFLTYNENGLVTSVSDSAGRNIAFRYDEQGNMIQRMNPNGDSLQYTYDDQHRIISDKDPYGTTYLVNTYDEQGRVLFQDDGDSLTPQISFQYTEHEDGTVTIKYTDRNGNQIISLADSMGNILSQKSKNGDEIICTYDEAGRMTEKIWGGHRIQYGYDEQGRLISYTDILGNTETYAYDAEGNCTAVTNDMGTTQYTYDSQNRKVSETNPQGVTTTYSYNDAGLLTACTQSDRGSIQYTYENHKLTGMQDREGNQANIRYDEAGRLIQYTDGEGNTIWLTYDGVGNVQEIRMQEAGRQKTITQTYTYDAVGNMLSYTDGNGNTTRYEYDIQDQLMAEIYPDGNRKECTRDGEGNITSIIYPETAHGSAMEQAVYDSAGNLTAVTDIYGYTTTYEYGAWGVLESITKPNGGRIQYEYYANGLLKCQTDAEGNTITLAYDKYGNVTQISDALGVQCKVIYDGYGQIAALEDGCGNRVAFSYDRYGQITASTDANGNTTTYEYDNNGNQIRRIDVLGRITEYGYNGNSQVVTVKRYAENGTDFIQSRYTYDMLGNITSLTDGEGNTYQLAYDNNSNLISIQDAYGYTIQKMEYDCRNQLIRTTDAAGTVTEQSYDAMGSLLSSTTRSSAGTASVLYQYGRNGILSQVIDAAGNTSGITYDTEGNITSITNPNGGVTEYTYDLNNRVLSEKIGEEYQIAYTYDVRGQVITRENSRGQVTEYTYDGCGRLISQTDDLGTIVYTYDNSGNLLTVTDEAGTITRTYDQAGRMISYTDTSGNQIEYEYDAYDNVTAIHYPDGRTVTYSYNKNGKVTSVTDWSGRVTNYTYNKNSQLITTERPDGSIEDRTYDEAGQLIRICDRQGDKILHQYDYSYDGNGNITGIDTEGEAVGGNNYSALQNCTMEYDENNRLISYNGESVAYDADGNMTYGPLQGVMTEFRYDCRNRLIQAGDTTYIYDAENNRIGVKTEDSSIRYVVDSQQELTRILQATETDTETGAETITCYTYGRGVIAQEKKANDSDTEYRLYHFNHLGSTTLITDEQGKIIETFDYNPYGELLDGEIGEYLFLFNGEYGIATDDNGLYYMRARYYNVDIKRFMNQDVIVGSVESSPSLNRYAYVEGNPVNYLDPFGLEKWVSDYALQHELFDAWSRNLMIVNSLAVVMTLLIPSTAIVSGPLLILTGTIECIISYLNMFIYIGDYIDASYDGNLEEKQKAKEGFVWSGISLVLSTIGLTNLPTMTGTYGPKLFSINDSIIENIHNIYNVIVKWLEGENK